MKILMLGGTGFLGRHIVDEAVRQKCDITLLNRGKTNPGLYPELRHIKCDRRSGIELPKEEKWDAVIDTSAYFPADIRKAMKVLKKRCGHYTLISSVSVYADAFAKSVNERSPLVPHVKVDTSSVTHENYGALKVLCEEELAGSFPGKALIIRPGLIVGPHDPSDRFTYWPMRIKRCDRVLFPQNGRTAFQIIDARDIARFILKNAAAGTAGTFNAAGPQNGILMRTLFNTCVDALNTECEPVNASADFLEKNAVSQWNDLPLWIKDCRENISAERAVKKDLTFTALKKTVIDTYEWRRTVKAPLRFGMKRRKELALIEKLQMKS